MSRAGASLPVDVPGVYFPAFWVKLRDRSWHGDKTAFETDKTSNTHAVPDCRGCRFGGWFECVQATSQLGPRRLRMAFVLIPHLDPKYESQMVALLSKVSLLPVVEATQGMVAEANHVYVIPSKNFLTIDDGRFQLSEPPTPQGREIAIDFFLRSLAKDQGERSIGIVLSGTGSHGTLGIRDIKLAGGMAIAQATDDCRIRYHAGEHH